MTTSLGTTRLRMALYDYYKNRRKDYQKRAYMTLGGQCKLCGSTDGIRHRFIEFNHPLANRYKTNPVTLYRKICREPSVRYLVCLVCRECRVGHRHVAQPFEQELASSSNSTKTKLFEGVNERSI